MTLDELYNTLTTLRALNGTMFMLIILPKCASKWWLTMYGPGNTLVWPFQKCDLEALHDYAPFGKVVENFIRNKLCLKVKSWKCVEHTRKGPTSQIEGGFQHLANSKSLIGSIKSTCSWHFIFQFHMVAQLGSLIWVVAFFLMETIDQVSLKMELSWTSNKNFQNSKKLFYHYWPWHVDVPRSRNFVKQLNLVPK
jgi:hypothetical protein